MILPVGFGSEEAAGGYQIERSLRFDSSASAYLNRTPAVAGNKQTWTWSGWVKRSALGGTRPLFGVVAGSCGDLVTRLQFDTSNRLIFQDFAACSTPLYFNLITTQVFRDVSAWFHVVAVVDTTQATSTNRVKLYVNGSQVTALGTAVYPLTVGHNTAWNSTLGHYIGREGDPNYFNGYLTEINFIDGQALDPTSFGEYNSTTGVWQPIEYTGSYGTNGFYLNFSDNSSVAALGYDAAGSNDWSVNGISVTAGVDNDSFNDTPTNNWATLNPLSTTATELVLSNGNIKATANAGGSNWGSSVSTIGVSSGKWVWEVYCTSASGSTDYMLGITSLAMLPLSGNSYPGINTTSYGYLNSNGDRYNNSTGTNLGFATYTAGDVIRFELDMDAGSCEVFKNDASQGTFINLLTGTWFPAVAVYDSASDVVDVGFGQAALNASATFDAASGGYFVDTPSSGFKALCTQNLPEPTIPNGREYFDVDVYTGIAGTYTKSGLDFQPDLIWGKARNAAAAHRLVDAVRGGTLKLTTSSPDAQNTDVAPYTFTSDGYSIPGGVNHNNNTGTTYAAWLWKANGAGVTNTDGSITSTVSADTDAGFSIVTYTATAADPITVGHGLGVAPSMFVVKSRSAAGTDWFVYHSSLGATKNLRINTLAGAATATNVWNDTAPTSTVITTSNAINTNTQTYVAYCFAAIPGYSAFGSYTGSTTKVFVYLGFRPAFVLLKKSSEASTTFGWPIVDNSRPFNTTTYEGYNPTLELWSDAPTNELSSTSNYDIDLLSNGFCINVANNANVSGSGKTYIYAAFAENPFKYSLAR
jgi:hypothetical protein